MFLAFNPELSSEVLQGPFPMMLFTEGTCPARWWCQWQAASPTALSSSVPRGPVCIFCPVSTWTSTRLSASLYSCDCLILLLIQWVLLAVSFQIWIHFRFPFHLSRCVLITQLGGKTHGFEGLLWSCVTLWNLHSWWCFLKQGSSFSGLLYSSVAPVEWAWQGSCRRVWGHWGVRIRILGMDSALSNPLGGTSLFLLETTKKIQVIFSTPSLPGFWSAFPPSHTFKLFCLFLKEDHR